jgi:RNA polymerase sigma-32 factor
MSYHSKKSQQEISTYMKEVSNIPLLTREEEVLIAEKALAAVTPKERLKYQNKLAEHNLRFVVRVANEFINYTKSGKIDLLDLIQEGNQGLIKATQKFDPSKGYRFVTYARWWIKARINTYVMSQHSLVRFGTTSAQRTLFFKMGEIRQMMEIRNSDKRDIARLKLAKKYKVKKDDVLDMEGRIIRNDLSLDQMVHNHPSGPSEIITFKDRLSDQNKYQDDLEQSIMIEDIKQNLGSCIEQLSDREQDIVQTRWLTTDDITLASLGEEYGISRERVRQIEERAFKKLRYTLQSKLSRETINQLS